MRNRCLSLVAFAMLLGASCSRQEQELILAEDVLVGELMTFEASFGENDGTKSAFISDDSNSWPVYWTPGDAINIFYGGKSSARFVTSEEFTSAGPKAEFVGYLQAATGTSDDSGESTTQNFWAVYPFDENNSCDGSSVTLTIPAEQSGVAGTFANNLNPTIAMSPNLGLAFYNVGSWFIFSLTQENVVSATLEGADGEALVGKVKVSMGTDNRPSIDQVTEGKALITMTPEGDSFQTGEYYCMVILPGTYNNGLILTLTKADGSKATCKVKHQDGSPMVLKRANWARKKNVDEGLVYKQVPQSGGHECVDMGNGIMWATMNVGATSLTDPGDLLTWNDGKSAVDAWGENWRMPSTEELQWLIENCTWTWSGTKRGMTVTSPNGNSIFLPVAGYIDEEHPDGFGTNYLGNYLSSSPNSFMEFEEGFDPLVGNGGGLSVRMLIRPVIDRIYTVPTGEMAGHKYVDMGNGTMWATMNVGATSLTDPGDLLTWNDGKSAVDAWGENWRMPSTEELQWLIENCTWTWSGTKKGMTVTSPNGNSIFLPVAGYIDEENPDGFGTDFLGNYLSSSPNSFMEFEEGFDPLVGNGGGLFVRMSVRPVF